jgi:mersacidin/lichenicidin family type 2 lantibiotic
MPKLDVVRAWKDEEYANSLTDLQKAMLPANPAGILELSDQDLHGASGGAAAQTPTITIYSFDPFCQSLMFSCITLGCTVTIGSIGQIETGPGGG